VKREIPTINKDFRQWQKNAYKATFAKSETGSRDFLCEATPGGGKTDYGLWVAHTFLQKKLASRLVVVAPTENLKEQWALSAASMGIDIDPEFKNSQGREASDYHGCVITYAQLGQDPRVHELNVFSDKTIVIFDEVHHAGESLSWGDGVRQAFENAVYRVALSGTAFRSDDNQIPFITYEAGVSVADFRYSYAEALKDNVCRPVFFYAFDGEMKYKVGTENFEHSFTDIIEKDLIPKRLKTALDPTGGWMNTVIIEAHNQLMDLRANSHKDAAGLVFAINQNHAREIAQVLFEITGIRPEVVLSDESNGCHKIDRFKKSSDPWIICVKMISEGIDIPRLRVGAYFTNVKADLFFRQAIGRFVRVIASMKGLNQDAYIFMPKDPDLVKLAEEIEKERVHALADCTPGDTGENKDLFGDYVPARKGSFEMLGSRALQSTTLRANVEITRGAKFIQSGEADLSMFERKHRLKETINLTCKRLALRDARLANSTKAEFNKYHKKWFDQGGKPIENETLEELQKRLEFVQRFASN